MRPINNDEGQGGPYSGGSKPPEPKGEFPWFLAILGALAIIIAAYAFTH